MVEKPKETGNKLLNNINRKIAKLKCSKFSTQANREIEMRRKCFVFYSSQFHNDKKQSEASQQASDCHRTPRPLMLGERLTVIPVLCASGCDDKYFQQRQPMKREPINRSSVSVPARQSQAAEFSCYSKILDCCHITTKHTANFLQCTTKACESHICQISSKSADPFPSRSRRRKFADPQKSIHLL